MAKYTIDVYWSGVEEYTEENGENIPEESGIYEILEKNENTEKYDRRYLGQTNDLRGRYYEHLSDDEENENISEGVSNLVCGLDFALIDDEDDRKDAEKGLYEKYDYQWNEIEPEGSGRNHDIEVEEHDT